jgi:hypothetical protein
MPDPPRHVNDEPESSKYFPKIRHARRTRPVMRYEHDHGPAHHKNRPYIDQPHAFTPFPALSRAYFLYCDISLSPKHLRFSTVKLTLPDLHLMKINHTPCSKPIASPEKIRKQYENLKPELHHDSGERGRRSTGRVALKNAPSENITEFLGGLFARGVALEERGSQQTACRHDFCIPRTEEGPDDEARANPSQDTSLARNTAPLRCLGFP